MASTSQSGKSAQATEPPSASAPPKPLFEILDLRAQYQTIREEIMEAVARVMDSQYFILGPEVKSFESEVAAYLGAPYAIGCGTGTDALVLALLAAGVGRGDEVVTTPFSFIATAGAIAWIGAKPVFVDIDPLTYNLDPARIESALTPRTRAILPVHLFGLSADLKPILDLASRKGIAVVEDACQAIGARYHGRAVGTWGDSGCFSFFPTKNLGGAGEGGLITTNSAESAERIGMLRVHGSKRRYYHDILGTNSRLDALQAAILRVKLRHLDAWADGRQRRAERYRSLFAEAALTDRLVLPAPPSSDYIHVYNQFTIRVKERDALRDYLSQHRIPSEVYYPLCIHLQPAFAHLGHKPGEFPIAERASQEVLSLPAYPELSDANQELVVKNIADFFSKPR